MGACGDKDRGADHPDHTQNKPVMQGKTEDKITEQKRESTSEVHKELEELDKHGHFDHIPSDHEKGSHVVESHHVTTTTTTYTVSNSPKEKHRAYADVRSTVDHHHSPKKEKHVAYSDMRSTVDHHKDPHHESSKGYSYSHETSDGKHRSYGDFQSTVETTHHYESKDGKHTAYGNFKS